jgi:hypothetical protein
MRVEIQVKRSAFGQALADMREWIDHNGGGDSVKFESTSRPNGHVMVALDFGRADLAVAFRRDWVEALANEPALAA